MKRFAGFPAKVQFTPLPGPFFSELLPEIDDLAEMKITLYVIWFLNQLEGEDRYIRRDDILQDEILMSGLEVKGKGTALVVDTALARAVERGSLLIASLELENGLEHFYWLNTPRGRASIAAIEKGDWRPSGVVQAPVALDLQRPNIYRLYEQNIGPLTPMLAEALREAEDAYPADWIEEAIRIAVENNVRRWRYVEAILRSWREEGRDDQNRRDTEKDRRYYLQDRFTEY